MKKFVEKMKRFWSLDAKANGGFTLVELIVVIAILAILAGIAVPAYSGYVEKAKKAEDEQLLATVNTAFAAACIENGTDVHSVDNAAIELNTDKSVKAVTVPATYDEAFQKFYAGNEDKKFEVMTGVTFSKDIHQFIEGIGVVYTLPDGSTVSISVSKEQAALVNDSTFMKNAALGVEGLTDKLDMVTTFAGAILTGDAESGSLATVLGSDDFLRSFAEYMNIDVGDKTGGELAAAIGAWNTDENGDPIYSDEESANMMANALVIYAAQKTTMDKASATALLGTEGVDAKQSILNTLTGNGVEQNTGEAMAQAALAYGMFTSYAYYTGNEDLIEKANDADNPVSVLHELESTEFKAYINSEQGQKDLDGYLASMGMINEGTANSAVAGDIVIDGFGNNTDLETLLKNALKNK